MTRFAHRPRRLLAAALIGVVVTIGLLLWVVVRIVSPGPASVDEAVERFREDGGAVEDPSRSARPPAGVYLYEGRGRERLSFPPLTQHDGESMPGTVTHEARGCWTFRLDYNASHWQEWRYCPSGQSMAEVGGATGQEWDLGVDQIGNVSRFVCSPPNPVLPPPAVGEAVTHSCTGTNSAVGGETTSAGSARHVGPETLTVGGAEVDTLHIEGRRTLSGAQDGDESTDAWFRADGLLVRYERDIVVHSDSPVGTITYTESGSLQLTDLGPRR